jgi:hypothetical protein
MYIKAWNPSLSDLGAQMPPTQYFLYLRKYFGYWVEEGQMKIEVRVG